MSIRERISESCGPETIMFDGCDDAIVGTSDGLCCQGRVVYSYAKLVDVFMSQGMDEDEAIEWIEFNVAGLYVENGPIVMKEIEH